MLQFNPCTPFIAINLSKPRRKNNNMPSDPFLNNTFSYNNTNFDLYDDENEEDLFSFNLANSNNSLRNYRDQREDEMQSQIWECSFYI